MVKKENGRQINKSKANNKLYLEEEKNKSNLRSQALY